MEDKKGRERKDQIVKSVSEAVEEGEVMDWETVDREMEEAFQEWKKQALGIK